MSTFVIRLWLLCLLLIGGALGVGAVTPLDTLAFERWRMPYFMQSQVYLLDVDTRITVGVSPLVDETGEITSEENPAWSPDGRRLLHSRGNSGEVHQLWLRAPSVHRASQLQGMRNQQVQGGDAVWSPDGCCVALDTSPSLASNILIFNLDSGAMWQAAPNPRVTQTAPEWSPDGTRLLFIGTASDISRFNSTLNTDAIYTVPVSGPDAPDLRQAEVVFATKPTRLNHAIWNEDGTGIYFSLRTEQPDTPSLFYLDLTTPTADGYEVTPIGGLALGTNRLALSPDGEWLAFSGVSRVSGEAAALYVVRTDGSGLRQVTRPSRDVVLDGSPSWQPALRMTSR